MTVWKKLTLRFFFILMVMDSFLFAKPLTVRFNNPGALKYNSDNNWRGSRYDGVGRFERFLTPWHGLRAMRIVVLKNIRVTNSVDEFVQRYARDDNQKRNDIQLVNYAKALKNGLGYSHKIKEYDIEKVLKILIIREGGQEALNYFKGELDYD